MDPLPGLAMIGTEVGLARQATDNDHFSSSTIAVDLLPIATQEPFSSLPSNNPFRRFSAFEILTEPDISDHSLNSPSRLDELPTYTEEIVPAYEGPHSHNQEPALSFCFYQVARKVQIITPATHATLTRPRYRISARSTTGIFSKKPSYTMTKLALPAEAASLDSKGEDVATMNFDRNGELPWMPRATVTHHVTNTGSTRHLIQAPNFSDWKLQKDGQTYAWCFSANPVSLVLVERSSMDTVARFTYSRLGTMATRGAEVGKMDFFGEDGILPQTWVEFVFATCVIVMQHWKSMGRHYKNEDMPRSASITGIGLTRGEMERIQRASQASTVL
ncbi:hypothetical protein BLS_007374 [Venturia inaequalis]|uniref:Uncharacterized protein n=1 Tax=Venturia inaequalis TaxID=5025 RepID=A0A8H3YPT4_VENIN|nr:hypothetical protein BLS_007374 [Venturia inaequalis]KAE9975927.1 hypothetical protein EG328_002913 [Venturia inaequalis]